MTKRDNFLKERMQSVAKSFLEKTEKKEIQIISHFDTDGITSATIMVQTLKKLDKKFSLKIVKSLEEQFIYDLPKNKITLFLDLGSGSLNHIKDSELKDVFILDHHEILQEIPENIEMINPEQDKKQKISSSSLTYLFCKELWPDNKELAKLAILGMIGDRLEKEIDKLNNKILEDGEIKRKRGFVIYPATRPLNRVLEFSTNPYIPGVTGNPEGILELLREIGLKPLNKKYKSLIELDKDEMEKLVTAILLRNPSSKEDILGDIFLIKFFNKLEDARELSAKINACSRSGESGVAIQYCMEIPKAKKRVETIHARYKQELISALKFASETKKIEGKNFVIINAKNKIKDTMVGTITSILASSPVYEKGVEIFTMAYYDDKIKISARVSGNTGRNVRGVLNNVIEKIGGEVGGHEFAAGCIIEQKKEAEFLKLLKKNLELEVIKI